MIRNSPEPVIAVAGGWDILIIEPGLDLIAHFPAAGRERHR